MKKYSKSFKNYLEALAARKPAPGGGSAAVLGLCLGVSLIEKAAVYSSGNSRNFITQVSLLRKLRHSAVPYVDIDAEIFERFMKAKGKKRLYYLRKSNEVMVKIANSCGKAFLLAKKIESGIKKSIISDFYMGLDFLEVALKGCILNLEANSAGLGKESIYIGKFRQILKTW